MDHKMSRSPWVIHYDGSSCNGCDIEVLASLTPLFDAERFGVVNTGNPKHADIFLVTGSVNAQNLPVVRQIYNQMLEPKCVVACGICACSGGVFRDAYNVIGGVDRAIPVDVYAPGCAIRPETVIDAIVEACGILDQKEAVMRAGGDQSFLITRDEMHGMFSGVLNETDRDAVTFTARIDAAIARLTGLDILRRSRDDEDSYTVSPVITAVMTASVITELQQQFEQLTGGGTDTDG